MQARDVMVSPVITVRASATVRHVASILLKHRISAVPVVDDGKVIGVVTESDLLHRTEAGTERPYSWWLGLLTGDAQMASDYVRSHAVKVNDVMTREVVTTGPETPLHEIAMLLEKHGIKRIPIVDRNDQLVGIVSRANLLQAVGDCPSQARNRTLRFRDPAEISCRDSAAAVGPHIQPECDRAKRRRRSLGLCSVRRRARGGSGRRGGNSRRCPSQRSPSRNTDAGVLRRTPHNLT